MALRFEWDPNKAEANRTKHGVTFEEAATTFADPVAVTIADPDHSDGEDRWIQLGLSTRNRLLVTVFVERDDVIRIISARLATKAEREQYEQRFE